ncbi:hypothetical protein D9M71_661120 [compost metagenome]
MAAVAGLSGVVTKIPASGSRLPKGEKPLNTKLARPSQKLRRLNTALITVGALRPVLRRTLMPLTWKMPSGCWVHLSKRDCLGLT